MLELIIAVLATYRLAHMMAFEDGPGDVFARWRGYVGQASWVGRGFHCILCLSFWLAWLFAAPAVNPLENFAEYNLFALAISGAIVVFHEVIDR